MNEQTISIFEVASKSKFRFEFKGRLATEDLWDLSVTDLDTIFKGLNAQVKQEKEESLLSIRSNRDKEVDTKIEIVKHIVSFKLDEQAKKANERLIKIQKQKILELLNEKEDDALKGKTKEELEEMLKNLSV